MEMNRRWQELHAAHHSPDEHRRPEVPHPHVLTLDRQIDAMLDLGKAKKWHEIEQVANDLKHECLTRGYYAIAALAERIREATATKQPEKNWKAPMLDIIWRLARAERLQRSSPLVGLAPDRKNLSNQRISRDVEKMKSSVKTLANSKTKQIFAHKASTKEASLKPSPTINAKNADTKHEPIPAPHAESQTGRSPKRRRRSRSGKR